MALRIFISHANQDTPFAERLANDLGRAGANVWLDATHMGPGPVDQRISRALDSSDVLVLVLTPDAIESRWVQAEMSAVIGRANAGISRDPIVVLAKSVPLRYIPSLWFPYHRINATASYEQALPQIVRELGLTLPVVTPPTDTPAVGTPAVPLPAPLVKPVPVLRKTPQPSEVTTPSPTPRAASAPKVAADPIRPIAAPSASVAPASTESMPVKPKSRLVFTRRDFLIGVGVIAAGAAGIDGASWIVHKIVAGIVAGTKRWSYQTSHVLDSPPVMLPSSPAIANGLVYVGSQDYYIYALDATTGVKRWSYQTEGPCFSLSVAKGIVYVTNTDENWGSSMLYALDATTGAKRWSYQTGDLGYLSPAIANGLVYVCVSDGSVYALDATTGAKRWSYQAGDMVHSSPAIANGLVYVCVSDGSVYALDATTGAKRWSYQTGSQVVSWPAVANGLVYVGSQDYYIYALDAATGVKRWSYQTGSQVESTPAVANGLVYVGSDDGSLYALDAVTGAKRWSYQTGGQVTSSPAIANGLVYVGSQDYYIYALDAATGFERWSYQTGGALNSAAVANGLVYIGSADGNIYAINA